MNMIRINPSSAANLTMGHHLLDLCGRYMEIWAKTSNQTAPHGTHFWAPLQQRERENHRILQTATARAARAARAAKTAKTCENSWISQNEPTGKPLLFFMKYQGDAYKFYLTPILGSSYGSQLCLSQTHRKRLVWCPLSLGKPWHNAHPEVISSLTQRSSVLLGSSQVSPILS